LRALAAGLLQGVIVAKATVREPPLVRPPRSSLGAAASRAGAHVRTDTCDRCCSLCGCCARAHRGPRALVILLRHHRGGGGQLGGRGGAAVQRARQQGRRGHGERLGLGGRGKGGAGVGALARLLEGAAAGGGGRAAGALGGSSRGVVVVVVDLLVVGPLVLGVWGEGVRVARGVEKGLLPHNTITACSSTHRAAYSDQYSQSSTAAAVVLEAALAAKSRQNHARAARASPHLAEGASRGASKIAGSGA